jgi:N-acetylmuramoyl-L-alanine amidase
MNKRYSMLLIMCVVAGIVIGMSFGFLEFCCEPITSEELQVIESGVYLTAELYVQPKEARKYVVHEYTEEEMQTELYDDSLELLAICVEAEAGNQDIMGKRLVVDVILNRVDSERFPNDITSVITQAYQFSSYTDGNMDKVWEPSEETYEAVRIELMERTNSEVLFFTEGRYNQYCEPLFIHGDHYFGR